ncbi:MAG TPA: PHB depolymerase family esterase [Polyangiaceae bacterium]|nr:PHB depolymerase family esterase [Polyangiaceae bacterium]
MSQSAWGTAGLPSYVNLYLYVPARLAGHPPILVAPHHCQGTGPGTYAETRSTLVPLADENGFLMIFPEATGRNCWDVGSTKSLTHDGGGDTHAIAQMVRYALATYGADATRVYAFGGSSGGMMTQALLGVYPDLFRAGVSVSGVPCGCWAVGYSGDGGPAPQWSGPCAGGNVIKTGAEWGDIVRAAFPGYAGPRPRVQLWHGTADTLVDFENQAEAVKEWTNVLGLSEAPASSDASKPGFEHQVWKSTCGGVALETWAQDGAMHAVDWDVASVANFLGLDVVGADPGADVCADGGATGAGRPDGGPVAPGAGGVPNGSAGGAAGESSSTGGSAGAVDGSGGTGGGQWNSGGGVVAGSGGRASGGSFGAPPGEPGDAGTYAVTSSDATASKGCACAIVDPGATARGLWAFSLPGGVLALRRRRRPE